MHPHGGRLWGEHLLRGAGEAVLLLLVHWRLRARGAGPREDGCGWQRCGGEDWHLGEHLHLLLHRVRCVWVVRVVSLGLGMWDEVAVVPVLWVGVWVVVEEGRSHCLLGHHGFHCVVCCSGVSTYQS